MDYCLGAGDGTASIWSDVPDIDLDGDGVLDGVRMNLDGDGLFDDALADFDGDDSADRAALDLDDDGTAEALATDDGTGAWALANSPAVRWFGLDGAQHSGAPADVDGDGRNDRLFDVDHDGLADRAVSADGTTGYVDTNGDGRWDLALTDDDGDGKADGASTL
jgi:hypothetical protein